jgi:glycine cleavage system transcriptional repressor
MKRTAYTFIGKDRPGIIAALTRSLFEAGCNVEDTTMTLLEDQFAMILIATIPNLTAEKKLNQIFDRIRKEWGLNHYRQSLRGNPIRKKHPPGTRSQVISVIGKDRTGIVYETSRILAGANLNITDLNSKILGKGKRALFVMVLEVDIPRQFNLKRLDSAWQKLRKRLKVDVRVKPLEHLAF